ncbi:hypothetical protein PRK78_000820 [Emydomyces testavorans]|uniref:non-specific serine/threonine protein kinase n=1 Tax=Emydomyces testavorans TaxID=2070801 RepID=A0AAF0IEU2_9EURO|nr:hypothetical protein PRK78_000820 [Emydomyces testavorans]
MRCRPHILQPPYRSSNKQSDLGSWQQEVITLCTAERFATVARTTFPSLKSRTPDVLIAPRLFASRTNISQTAGWAADHSVRYIKTGQEVALKLEYVQIDPSLLENEIEIYEELSGGPGIPRVYWHGEECEFRVMVFELLGPNLENLFNYCGWKFSLKTVLLLADQIIPRFQYIHSDGYIHRDVKPDNLLMGDGK